MSETYIVGMSQNPQNKGPDMIRVVPEMVQHKDGEVIGDSSFTSLEKAIEVATKLRKSMGLAYDPDSTVFVLKWVWPSDPEEVLS